MMSNVDSQANSAEVLVGHLLEQVETACFQFRREFKALCGDNVAVKQRMRGCGQGYTHPGRSQIHDSLRTSDYSISDIHTGDMDFAGNATSTATNDVESNVGAHAEPLAGDFSTPLELAMRNAHEQHAVSTVWEKGAGRKRWRTELEPVSVEPRFLKVQSEPSEVSEHVSNVLVTAAACRHRAAWDVVGVFFILYDLVMIPMRAFSPPVTIISVVIEWIIMIYWTLNTIMSFFISYVDNGVVVVEPCLVAKHYLKTWFLLDLLVLAPDWYLSLRGVLLEQADSADEASGAVKFLRIFRLAKCLRLLRAAKLRKLSQALTDRIDSEYTGVMVHILKMVFLLFLVNHYVASFWFIVGTMGHTNSWIKEYKYDSVDWLSKYAVCFHWGITQFTPASKVGVQPVNLMERFYAILVVIFALLGFSYMLGSITSSLTQLRTLSEDEDRQFYEVRRYLRRQEVSKTLGCRILRFLEFEYARVRKLNDGTNVRLFALLSDELRSELHAEISLPVLQIHPLFALFSLDFTRTLQRIVTRIQRKSLAVGETLFFPGEHATHLHFLDVGELAYQSSMGSAGTFRETEHVRSGEAWISEPVIWTSDWVHVGHMHSVMASQIVMVGPKEFAEAVSLSPAAWEVVASYAHNFVQWLNSQPPDLHTDVFFIESYSLLLEGLIKSSSSRLQRPLRRSGSDLGMTSL